MDLEDYIYMQAQCEDALDEVQTAGDDWNKVIREKANEITNQYRQTLYRKDNERLYRKDNE